MNIVVGKPRRQSKPNCLLASKRFGSKFLMTFPKSRGKRTTALDVIQGRTRSIGSTRSSRSSRSSISHTGAGCSCASTSICFNSNLLFSGIDDSPKHFCQNERASKMTRKACLQLFGTHASFYPNFTSPASISHRSLTLAGGEAVG